MKHAFFPPQFFVSFWFKASFLIPGSPTAGAGALEAVTLSTWLKQDEAASAGLWVYTTRSASCCRNQLLKATSSLAKFPLLGPPPSAAAYSNGQLCLRCPHHSVRRSLCATRQGWVVPLGRDWEGLMPLTPPPSASGRGPLWVPATERQPPRKIWGRVAKIKRNE